MANKFAKLTINNSYLAQFTQSKLSGLAIIRPNAIGFLHFRHNPNFSVPTCAKTLVKLLSFTLALFSGVAKTVLLLMAFILLTRPIASLEVTGFDISLYFLIALSVFSISLVNFSHISSSVFFIILLLLFVVNVINLLQK